MEQLSKGQQVPSDKQKIIQEIIALKKIRKRLKKVLESAQSAKAHNE